MTTKKKLLLWSPFGSGMHYCGPATYTHRIYSTLDQNRYSAELAHGYKPQAVEECFTNQTLIGEFGSGRLKNLLFSQQGKGWAKVNASRFDLVHAISGFEASVGPAAVAKQLGLPVALFVITKDGGLTNKGGLPELLGFYSRRQEAAKNFDAIITLSSEISDELTQIGINEESIVRIPNFADTKKYFPLSAKAKIAQKESLNLPQSIPTVAFVGKLAERKRPHLLLEALHALKQKGKTAHGVFVGPEASDSAYSARLQELTAKHQLSCTFTGFTTEVERWLQAADMFCLPSTMEGMPAAVIEAIACGLPAIVSPFSSAYDIIQDERIGCIAEESSCVYAIAEAISHYADEEAAQEAIDFRTRLIRERFSLQAVTGMYESLFERLISGGVARG